MITPLSAVLIVVILTLIGIIVFLVLRTINQGVKAAERTVGTVSSDVKDVAVGALKSAERIAAPVSTSLANIGNAIADNLRITKGKLEELQLEALKLAQEVEYLKSQKIDVNEFRGIIKIALIDAQFSTKDVFKTIIREEEESFIGFNKTKKQIEYLGIIKLEFKQRLGIDLEKVKFSSIDESRIGVFGLGQIESIGSVDIKIQELMSEIRKVNKGKVESVDEEKYAGLKNDENVKHRDMVVEIINKNPDVRHLEDSIEEMAYGFLRSIFQKSGITLVKLKEEPTDFIGILKLVEVINNNTEKKIKLKDVEIKNARDNSNLLLEQLILVNDSKVIA